MSKLLGFILLVAGCVMPYFGWQAREAALAIAGGNPALAIGSQSVSLLTMGAISVAGCLAFLSASRVNILSVFQPKILHL